MTSMYRIKGLIQNNCGLNPLCYNLRNVENFINLDTTREALHVSEKLHKWALCNTGINLKFHMYWMKDFSPYAEDLLNGGIPALTYAGGIDFTCN